MSLQGQQGNEKPRYRPQHRPHNLPSQLVWLRAALFSPSPQWSLCREAQSCCVATLAMFSHILSTTRSSRGLAQSIISCLAQVFLPVAQGSYMETTVNGGRLNPLVPWIQTVLQWHVLKWQNNTPDRSRSHYNKVVAKHSSASFLQQALVSPGFSAVLTRHQDILKWGTQLHASGQSPALSVSCSFTTPHPWSEFLLQKHTVTTACARTTAQSNHLENEQLKKALSCTNYKYP